MYPSWNPSDIALSLSRSPVVPFYPFWGRNPPTKIDYGTKVATLILISLLEDLDD